MAACRQVLQGQAGGAGAVRRNAESRQDSGKNVYQGSRRRNRLPFGHTRSREDQGNARRLVVQGHFRPQAAVSVVVAVVAGIDHQRIVRLSALLQCRQHLPDLVVQETAEPVVGCPGHLPGLIGEPSVVVEIARERPGHGMPASFMLSGKAGMIHPFQGVEAVEGFRTAQGIVRPQPGNEQGPRPVRAGCGRVAEPLACRPGDPGVVVGITARPWPDVAGVAGAVQHCLVIPEQALDPAHAVTNVEREDLAIESVVRIRPPVVQLADGFHPEAMVLQHMPPSPGFAVVGLGVVPAAGCVHIPARCQ